MTSSVQQCPANQYLYKLVDKFLKVSQIMYNAIAYNWIYLTLNVVVLCTFPTYEYYVINC